MQVEQLTFPRIRLVGGQRKRRRSQRKRRKRNLLIVMGIEKEDLRAREEQEIQQDVRAREEGPQDVEIGVLAEKHLKVATRTSLMTYTILAFDEVVALEEGKAVTCYGVHGHA